MQVFQLVLEVYIHLAKLRHRLEKDIHNRLERHADYQRLRTIPGVGPIVALTILAEAGDLRRFSHHRKSGQRRGVPHLSKRGNAQLRCAFWMAGGVAVAQRRNCFRKKFDDYVRSDPKDTDLKRKAYTAVAAKMARMVYGLIKTNSDYRHYLQEAK